MNHHNLTGGIPFRITGLVASLLRHLLSLGALASEEARLFISQSIAGIILLIALVVVSMIAYLAFIACVISLLAMYLHWGWPLSLAAAGIIHIGFVALLYRMLLVRIKQRPFQTTSAELKRDIEALGSFSSRSP